MELPATLPRAPARLQARAGEEADTNARQDAQAGAGPPPRRPPSFYSSVFAQIEEIGWEQLVSATGDGVSFLTFRVMDEPGRIHLLEITLPMGYPARLQVPLQSLQTIAACHIVEFVSKILWTKSSRLKDVLCQFQAHLKILQEFWSTMDEIDKVLWVVDPTKPTYAMSHRRISLGDGCYILLHIDAHKPSSLPEDVKKKFHENLAAVLDSILPAPPVVTSKMASNLIAGYAMPSIYQLMTSSALSQRVCDRLHVREHQLLQGLPFCVPERTEVTEPSE